MFITECASVSGIVLHLGTRDENEVDKKCVLAGVLDVTRTERLVGECCGPSRRELESPEWPGKVSPQRQPVDWDSKAVQGEGPVACSASGQGAVGGGERTEGGAARGSGRWPCWLMACEWDGAASGALSRSSMACTGCSAAEEQEAAAVSQARAWSPGSSQGEGVGIWYLCRSGQGGQWWWEV